MHFVLRNCSDQMDENVVKGGGGEGSAGGPRGQRHGGEEPLGGDTKKCFAKLPEGSEGKNPKEEKKREKKSLRCMSGETNRTATSGLYGPLDEIEGGNEGLRWKNQLDERGVSPVWPKPVGGKKRKLSHRGDEPGTLGGTMVEENARKETTKKGDGWESGENVKREKTEWRVINMETLGKVYAPEIQDFGLIYLASRRESSRSGGEEEPSKREGGRCIR